MVLRKSHECQNHWWSCLRPYPTGPSLPPSWLPQTTPCTTVSRERCFCERGCHQGWRCCLRWKLSPPPRAPRCYCRIWPCASQGSSLWIMTSAWMKEAGYTIKVRVLTVSILAGTVYKPLHKISCWERPSLGNAKKYWIVLCSYNEFGYVMVHCTVIVGNFCGVQYI